MVMDPKGSDLLPNLAKAARVILEAPLVGYARRSLGEREFSWEGKDALVDQWRGIPAGESPLETALAEHVLLRISTRPDPPRFSEWTRISALEGIEETLIAPFSQPVVGFEGCVWVAWPKPHFHLALEEEALGILIHQVAISYENAVYSVMAAQARDVWQAVFESIPSPVAISGGDGRILQANGAFLRMFETREAIGVPLASFLEGATDGSGRPASLSQLTASDESAFDLDLPGFGGRFGISRGPYFGPDGRTAGTVWLFRRREKTLVA